VIVGILFLINIVFFVAVRLGKVDLIVKEKVENYLADKLNASIDIRDFTFNDKQLNINGFQITGKDNEYLINVKQIYIEYNLSLLIFSNFTNYKAIKDIKIFEPSLEIDYRSSSEEGISSIEIPDIARYFKHLSLYNGKIDLSYRSTTVEFEAIIDTLNLKIQNSSRTELDYHISNSDSSSSTGSIILRNGKILKTDLTIVQFLPEKIKINGIDDLSCKVDLNISQNDEQFTTSGVLNNLQLSRYDREIIAERVPFTATDKDLEVKWDNASLDENRFSGIFRISNYLQQNKVLSGQFDILQAETSRYFKDLIGYVDLHADLSGTISDPIADIDVQSSSLKIYRQELANIIIKGYYKNDSIAINLDQLYLNKNKIVGEGHYKFNKDLNLKITANNFKWNYRELDFEGDLRSEINYKKDINVDFRIRDVGIKYKELLLSDLAVRGMLKNSLLDLTLSSSKEDLKLICSGDLQKRELKAALDLSRFDLSKQLNNNSLPQISGSLDFKANEEEIITNAAIRIFDRNYAVLDGRFIFNSNVNLVERRSNFSIRSSSATCNFEPFSLNIIAEGDLDSLNFNKFDINKEITVSGWAKFDPTLEIDANISFNSINLRDYLKYFSNYSLYNSVSGEASLDLNYKSYADQQISGSFWINDLKYDDIIGLDITNNISGSLHDLNTKSSIFFNRVDKIVDLDTEITLIPEFSLNSSGRIDELDLNKLYSNNDVTGILKANLFYCYNCNERTLDMDVEVNDLAVNWFEADSLKLDLIQQNNLLEIKRFEAGKKKRYSVNAKGKIGYNILNSNIYPDSNTVRMQFNGDLLRMLSGQTSIINGGRSECAMNLNIGVDENGLSIQNGKIDLKKASVRFKEQLETVEKIKINIEIIDNQLFINRFTGKMGDGKFFLENLIEDTENEFLLGNVRIGKLLVHTNEDGVLVHIPGYMPGNSVAKAVVKGRITDELIIYGPFDDIVIYGDVYIYNGSGIYPSNTENLVKFVSKITEEKSSPKYDIPIQLDLALHFEENIRYVTYPLNLLTEQGSYLNLKFDNEEFSVTDAYFSSENGFIDIFGTQMLADYVQVKISPYQNIVQVNGTFYKKASDGTLITLVVTSIQDPVGNKVFALDFDLQSDNANDSRTDILALLRYNRRQDEISPDQRKTLLQDEVIQLAGLGIESAVLDPFISPVETWIRKILNLDFFHLQTDLIQNIFHRYSSDQTDYVVDEEGERLSQKTGELFLNNLSIGMGKYLSRKIFLDYELEFQKPQDLSVESDMGIYHNFSIRYDLPFRLKLAFKYHIRPFNEMNDHELSLEKSIRF